MAALPGALLFAAGEARLAGLDALARTLWLPSITHSQGALEARLEALSRWLAALQRPEPDRAIARQEPGPFSGDWPPPSVALPLERTLRPLQLQRYCQEQPALAETVVKSLLFHLDFVIDYQDRGATEAQAIEMALAAFADEWTQRSGEMDDLLHVFGMLPQDSQSLRWDVLQGLLQSGGWQEVLRMHRLLEALPELRRILRTLGRSRATELPDPRTQTLAPQEVLSQQQVAREQTVRVPDMPGQTQGIHRADRIARMLPSESLLLGYPKLRLLWHARRAERTLLCYQDDDRLSEQRQQPVRVRLPQAGPAPAHQHVAGPLLVCVDTSGSMQGGAEAVAKAVVLEAMRVAHAEQRACHVFAFGGESEVVELELPMRLDGIQRLTEFLGQAFHGGTDICGPLERVIARLEEVRWQRADLLMATDGEFGATPELAARLDGVKRQLGLRVQGVLLADRETLGLLEVCDHIFPVRDWRRFGGVHVESPVHTSSLTALYFPGAVRRTGA